MSRDIAQFAKCADVVGKPQNDKTSIELYAGGFE
jgi:hypothetical protein